MYSFSVKRMITKAIRLLASVLVMLIIAGCTAKQKQEAAIPATDIMEATISGIHQAYQNGEYNCEQLVTAYIRRIEAYDQATGLNSIILINTEALNTARELDAEYQRTNKLRPLHGIPIIVKDNYITKGIQTTAGSLAMKGFIPDRTAYQVKALEEAGAIILAKSNMAEWAFSPAVTISSISGETLNPYNLEHVPAGSSGGTAAAVAANFGTVGLGTDTGNSIRGPSSHNALVGFRSTLGLTSREGIVPLYLRNDVGGPMTRTVEDAVRMLEVIAGYDPNDPVTIHCRERLPSGYQQFLDINGLKGARIGVLRCLNKTNPDPQVSALFEQAIADLKRLGAEVIDPFDIPGFDTLSKGHWCPVFQHDLNAFLATCGKDAPVRNLEEIVNSGKYSPYIEDRLHYFLENETIPGETPGVCSDPYTDYRRVNFRNAIEQAMDEFNVGAIIYPTWNHPPARKGDIEGYKGDNSQIIAPHTGQPAFTIPMGYTRGNLPAGLQFLGRMFDEPTLIKYCYAYEQGTMHRKPPELFPELSK